MCGHTSISVLKFTYIKIWGFILISSSSSQHHWDYASLPSFRICNSIRNLASVLQFWPVVHFGIASSPLQVPPPTALLHTWEPPPHLTALLAPTQLNVTLESSVPVKGSREGEKTRWKTWPSSCKLPSVCSRSYWSVLPIYMRIF